jgi:hypothetical protein
MHTDLHVIISVWSDKFGFAVLMKTEKLGNDLSLSYV